MVDSTELTQRDLNIILSKAEKVGNMYMFKDVSPTYRPATERCLVRAYDPHQLVPAARLQYLLQNKDSIPVEARLDLDNVVEGVFIFDPRCFHGVLDIDLGSVTEQLPHLSLTPNRQLVTSFGNYDAADSRVTFHTIDLLANRWSLHCGFHLPRS